MSEPPTKRSKQPSTVPSVFVVATIGVIRAIPITDSNRDCIAVSAVDFGIGARIVTDGSPILLNVDGVAHAAEN